MNNKRDINKEKEKNRKKERKEKKESERRGIKENIIRLKRRKEGKIKGWIKKERK